MKCPGCGEEVDTLLGTKCYDCVLKEIRKKGRKE